MPLSDDEVHDACREMQDAIWAMIEETGMDDSMGLTAGSLRHVNTLTSLSLERMEAEYDRMTEVELKITHSGDAKEELEAAKYNLKDWRGMAAEEFDRKLQNLHDHVTFFGPFSTKLTHYVGGFYSLALHSRQSLYDLCKQTAAGALQVINDQEAREQELLIAVGNSIVQKALDLDPAKAARQMLSALVDATAAVTTYMVKGHNGSQVIGNYLNAADAWNAPSSTA